MSHDDVTIVLGSDPLPEPRADDALDREGVVNFPATTKPALAPSDLQAVYFGEGTILPPPALVKDTLPKDGIAIIGGQSGAGKTFIVCNLAVALASEAPFFGRRVKERVGVAILAAEGASTLPSRLKVAAEAVVGGDHLPIAHTPIGLNLLDKREVDRVVQHLREVDEHFRNHFGVRLGAIFIDTLAAAFDLKDENDNAEASKAIRRMRSIAGALNAVVVGVHHYGKDKTTGLRGASAWRAGADAVISVLADRDELTGQVSNRSLALAKSRVGEEGPIAPFELKGVLIGKDEDGDAVTSCIIVPALHRTGELIITTERKKSESAAVTAFKKAFDEALNAFGETRAVQGNGPMVRMVAFSHVRDAFARFYVTGESDEKKREDALRSARNRALKQVRAAHLYAEGVWDGTEWIWQSS